MGRAETGKDKRKFQRIPREVSIEVSKVRYPMPEEAGEGGTVKDIGQDGVCFTVSTPYEPKTLLSLRIYLRGWQHHKKGVASIIDDSSATAPLTAVTEVVWSKKCSDSPDYDIGVKFIDIYGDDFSALKAYLDKILTAIK